MWQMVSCLHFYDDLSQILFELEFLDEIFALFVGSCLKCMVDIPLLWNVESGVSGKIN